MRDKNPSGEDPFIHLWLIDRASEHAEIEISRARELLSCEP